jgi:hypothetical protein
MTDQRSIPYSAAAEVSAATTRDDVVAGMTDMLLRLATWGLHDSRREELREYAKAARSRYAELTDDPSS